MMQRLLISTVALAALLGAGGCSILTGSDVPAAPSVAGDSAEIQALRDGVHRDPNDSTPVFQPLEDAKAAVAAAKAQNQVQSYDADSLNQAEQALSQAEDDWQAIAGKKKPSDQQLQNVADQAHRAERLAQIAQYTAQRETGLDALNRYRAEQAQQAPAAAGQSAAGASDQTLVNRRVVPKLLGSLRFQQGTARLTDASRPVIGKLAQLIKQHPKLGVAIFGFTDNAAPPTEQLKAFVQANPQIIKQNPSQAQKVMAYRQGLSDARARDVAQLLVEAGIDPKRIGARGLRDQHPIASNDTAAGRRQNERAEAIMVPMSAMQKGSGS